MRYQITSIDLLRQMLSEIHDDLFLPWNTYPCLEWPRGRQSALRGFDYGLIVTGGRTFAAHRLAYWIDHNIDPGDLSVCHHCDNPPCVRPSHLFLGTKGDNNRDCSLKGRSNARNGMNHYRTSLTEKDVRQIRLLRSRDWTYREIAERFGIGSSSACLIATRKNWKHVA